MDLNTTHPQFSFDMEVLCLLPCEPDKAMIRDLVEDLGVEHQRDVGRAMGRLIEKGYAIQSSNLAGRFIHERGRVAWIDAVGWETARKAGRAYMDTLYPRSTGDEP